MLLSIDRVLQLLAEGKTIEKISELAGCAPDDVAAVIKKARELIKTSCRDESRRKILIKKKISPGTEPAPGEVEMLELKQRFSLIELSAIPYNDLLVIHAESFVESDPGDAAIGIVIYDRADNTAGRMGAFVGRKSRINAALIAILRALEVAVNYKPSQLKIRSSSEAAVKMINGETDPDHEKLQQIIREIRETASKVSDWRIEHVSGQMVDKAVFLAEKALQKNAAGRDGV